MKRRKARATSYSDRGSKVGKALDSYKQDQSTSLESSEKQVYQDLSGISRHYEKLKEELLQVESHLVR